ncbi:MAG TPA: DUF4034 domain-containing protein [Sulfuricaulis sp.]|nr:DUF4034 domain-containing protein [Sulfuricaulis sp.]
MNRLLKYLLVGLSLTGCVNTTLTPSALPREDESLLLLKQQNFDEVSKRLSAIQQVYLKNPLTENELHKAFYVFYRADKNIQQPLDEWVRNRPKDAMAYLARGIYRTKLGWTKRGTKWASDTNEAQISGMKYWFDLAKQDLSKAITLDGSLTEAYCYLMEIDMNEGGNNSASLLEKALTINPLSLTARWYFLTSRLPRWGGSYEEMNKTIIAARQYYDQFSHLKILEGRIAADIGDQYYFSNNCPKAIEYYRKALENGNFWFYNEQLGECLYQIDDYQGAMTNLSAVIKEKPGYKQAYWMRSQSYKMLENYDDALRDINYAIDIEPEDDATIAARGFIYMQFSKNDRALEDLRAALKLNPSNDQYQLYISQLESKLKGPGNH